MNIHVPSHTLSCPEGSWCFDENWLLWMVAKHLPSSYTRITQDGCWALPLEGSIYWFGDIESEFDCFWGPRKPFNVVTQTFENKLRERLSEWAQVIRIMPQRLSGQRVCGCSSLRLQSLWVWFGPREWNSIKGCLQLIARLCYANYKAPLDLPISQWGKT